VGMVMPGGPDDRAPLSISPDDLRQLADHDARHRTFDGGAGPLTALDTGGDGAHGTVLLVPGFTGSTEDFAPLLRPLCAAGYGVATPPLVGHSFGGLVSRAAVLAEPAAFSTLTLLGSGPSRLVGPRVELLEHLTPLLDAGGVPLVHETLEQLAMTDPRAQLVPAPTREFLARRFLATRDASLRGMADAMTTEPDRVAALAATGVPVLVAHGVADDAWTPAVQADMARRLRRRHPGIPGGVHPPPPDEPAPPVGGPTDL